MLVTRLLTRPSVWAAHPFDAPAEHTNHQYVEPNYIEQVVLNEGQLEGVRLEMLGSMFDGVLDPVGSLVNRRHGHLAISRYLGQAQGSLFIPA